MARSSRLLASSVRRSIRISGHLEREDQTVVPMPQPQVQIRADAQWSTNGYRSSSSAPRRLSLQVLRRHRRRPGSESRLARTIRAGRRRRLLEPWQVLDQGGDSGDDGGDDNLDQGRGPRVPRGIDLPSFLSSWRRFSSRNPILAFHGLRAARRADQRAQPGDRQGRGVHRPTTTRWRAGPRTPARFRSFTPNPPRARPSHEAPPAVARNRCILRVRGRPHSRERPDRCRSYRCHRREP